MSLGNAKIFLYLLLTFVNTWVRWNKKSHLSNIVYLIWIWMAYMRQSHDKLNLRNKVDWNVICVDWKRKWAWDAVFFFADNLNYFKVDLDDDLRSIVIWDILWDLQLWLWCKLLWTDFWPGLLLKSSLWKVLQNWTEMTFLKIYSVIC